MRSPLLRIVLTCQAALFAAESYAVKYTNLDDCRAKNGVTCKCSKTSTSHGNCIEWEGQNIAARDDDGTWGLDELPLSDGGAVNGSFAYVPGSGVLENVTVESSSGDAAGAVDYVDGRPVGPDGTQYAFYSESIGDLRGARVLLLTLSRPIEGGEPIEILAMREGVCDDGECGLDRLLRTADGVGADGDYNGDGVIDASDYTVWRDAMASDVYTALADGDSNGVVDQGDFAHWAAAFNTSAAPSAAVPEASAMTLAACLLVGSLLAPKRR